jgi:hypothetical protein
MRCFIWLACQDICWSGDRLSRWCLPHPPSCPFCDQTDETWCPFSRMLWHEVLSWIRSIAHPLVVDGDFAKWWALVL